MRGNLNAQFWLDNDTKHLENVFTSIFYKLTRGSAPRQFYKKYLYKAFSKYYKSTLSSSVDADKTDYISR